MSTSEITIERPLKPGYTAKVFMERRTQSLPIDFPDRRKPVRRAMYECEGCGEEFFGADAATQWINHRPSMMPCPKVAARERLQNEMKATLAAKEKIEDELRRAFDKAVDRLGFVRAIESIARECEAIGERDVVNSDCWLERSVTLHEAAQVGSEEL